MDYWQCPPPALVYWSLRSIPFESSLWQPFRIQMNSLQRTPLPTRWTIEARKNSLLKFHWKQNHLSPMNPPVSAGRSNMRHYCTTWLPRVQLPQSFSIFSRVYAPFLIDFSVSGNICLDFLCKSSESEQILVINFRILFHEVYYMRWCVGIQEKIHSAATGNNRKNASPIHTQYKGGIQNLSVLLQKCLFSS